MRYFDFAASTPISKQSLDVFNQLSVRCFGNASSLHDSGGEAKYILDHAREDLALQIGADARGIYFTSGGTESNLLSIISLAKARRHYGNHLIVTAGEHPSVDSAMEYLKTDGFCVTVIPFTETGVIDLGKLDQAIGDETILISVQHVNPEIGTIQPIKKIAERIERKNILLHCDCVQSLGKIDVRPIVRWIDAMTFSSHKVYGPKGVGAVYINPRHRLVPVFPGLIQESGFRGGTLNVPGIAAFVTAAADCIKEERADYLTLRRAFLGRLEGTAERFTIYEGASRESQLPQIIGLGVKQLEGQLVMLELNRRGFAVSTGSACQAGMQHAAKTMTAMGIAGQQAKEFIRISFGKGTTEESVIQLADELVKIASMYRVNPISSRQV